MLAPQRWYQPAKPLATNRVDKVSNIFVSDQGVRHSNQHSIVTFKASRAPPWSDPEAVAVQRDVDDRSGGQPKVISENLWNDDSS
jgi:hypothetical protein